MSLVNAMATFIRGATNQQQDALVTVRVEYESY